MVKRLVSPVVATILILVITVALAGALLVFLMNWQGEAMNVENLPKQYVIDIREGWVTAKAWNDSGTLKINVSLMVYSVNENIPADEKVIIMWDLGNYGSGKILDYTLGTMCPGVGSFLEKGDLADNCNIVINTGQSYTSDVVGSILSMKISLANSNTVPINVEVEQG